VDVNPKIPLDPQPGLPSQRPVSPEFAPVPVWLIAAVTTLVASTMVGAALAPYLAVHHPLWLLALNPWQRHQILVAPHTPVVPFVMVASLRGLLACAVFYELGQHYGARTLTFLAERSPQSVRYLQAVEEMFERFSLLLLAAAPGVLTSALAGMSGVSQLFALLLSWFGLVVWAAVNHRVGGFLAPWTVPILDFLRDNMLLATGLCSLAVVAYQLSTRRKKPPPPPAAPPTSQGREQPESSASDGGNDVER
jgi:membrane protein DedA with SNARE-associated domain